jgi:hypothetical protein
VTATRAFACVEYWEHRDDRGPADQCGGGVVHPNGTQIVSGSVPFLAACVRAALSPVFVECVKAEPAPTLGDAS